MASLGHVAVGAAAARIYGATVTDQRPSFGAVAFWSAVSLLPDADVVGFAVGVHYGDEWGHRGATHSFVFAAAVGLIIGIFAPMVRRPAMRTAITASLVLASHPLLDVLTDGGLGCALFWPFDQTRYFAPWRPLPVAPIGLGMFSSYGMFVVSAEAILFAPVWWYAFRARRAA